MNRVILQVPMSKDLKQSASKVAADYGFSSLQEVIRFFLSKFAKKEMTIDVHADEEITHLSPRAKKYYAQAMKDIRAGKNIYKPKNKEEFFKMLRS